ncbi:MAG: cytochrome b/b6 domain-containing protein, partial [Rhodocyclaceae bacterium]|nr:cytochrome b/b6 domain-containing protein [Rhodocyclaceae bacterium]
MEPRLAIWDIPTRLFHWSFATSFVVVWMTHESERLMNLHIAAGYFMLGLIGFRLLWGIIGNRYARFSEFVRGPSAVLRYVTSILEERPERHLGHNPLGAISIVLLLALGLGTGMSGWLIINDLGGELFEELHEGLAGIMLAVVGLHLVGVAVSSFLHQENLVLAMITGYKKKRNYSGLSEHPSPPPSRGRLGGDGGNCDPSKFNLLQISRNFYPIPTPALPLKGREI